MIRRGPIKKGVTLKKIFESVLRWWYIVDISSIARKTYPGSCTGLSDTVLNIVGIGNLRHYETKRFKAVREYDFSDKLLKEEGNSNVFNEANPNIVKFWNILKSEDYSIATLEEEEKDVFQKANMLLKTS